VRRGTETVPGLGARKQLILATGGNVLDLAVAMLETREMLANYPLGDVYPNGAPKTGDAANFGIFKQNWLMIRTSMSQYAALGAADYLRGQALNHALRLDIDTLHASQTHHGLAARWWAGHRNGATGLAAGTLSKDIHHYRDAVFWIRSQLSLAPANLTNDTRWWCDLHPI
jgi:hypothetical protein